MLEANHNDDDPNHDDDGLALDAVFTEPPRPPTPEATFATYNRQKGPETGASVDALSGGGLSPSSLPEWSAIRIRLVGSHPLWGHYLWNAARAFASYLDANAHIYHDKNVLELGAGGGLPSLVTVLNGARKTVLTDYPDNDLIDNLRFNVHENVATYGSEARAVVLGYIWGTPVTDLLGVADAPDGFDLIILSDLIFNHSQHDALLETCKKVLRKSSAPAGEEGKTRERGGNDKPEPVVLVFYTHHRPRLASRDLEFFTKARARGWNCDEIVTERYPPMFPDDPGEEAIRSTVHGWRLTRN